MERTLVYSEFPIQLFGNSFVKLWRMALCLIAARFVIAVVKQKVD